MPVSDVGEFIEIAGPAGFDLTGWSLVLYNGNGGAPYGTTPLTGTIPSVTPGYGFVVVNYPTNGIQNGAPDGIALVQEAATVSTEGVVVGDFQSGLGGFFIQDSSGDGSLDTSDGLFISEANAPAFGLQGQMVRVRGTVTEIDELTQLTNVTVLLDCGAASIPATPVVLPVGDSDVWEQYEGMLVTFPQDLYITEFFNFDRHNEIVVATERHYQPTNVMVPGPAAVAEATAQELERITLDDGRLGSNLDPTLHPDGNEFTLTNYFRGGDILQGVTGILNQRYDRSGSRSSSNELQYRIDPTVGATHVVMNPRPSAPDPTGGTVTVASFNVLNFFTNFATDSDFCGGRFNPFCRGANDQNEYDRQLAKLVNGILGLDADIVGLQEIENDVRTNTDGSPTHEAITALVDALNVAVDAPAGDPVWMGGGEADYYNTYPITNEIIYRKGAVTPLGPPKALKLDAPLTYPLNLAFDAVRSLGADPVGRAPLAQSFADNNGEVFTVVVNHFKSKGSFCGDVLHPVSGDVLWTDAASTTGQANCNVTRVKQAEALMEWITTDPTGLGDPDVLVIGDLNSYAKEDPISVIEGESYTNLLEEFEGSGAYTYVFDGRLGNLDHALGSASILSQVTGTTAWLINADEVDLFDYNTSFLQPPQAALYEDEPYRVSDHDPVVVGLALISPKALKETAQVELEGLLPTGSSGDDRRIQKATDHIDQSLNSAWLDPATLDPETGKRVFDYEHQAARELEKVKTVDVQSSIEMLVIADQRLALTELFVATSEGANSSRLNKAVDNLADAAANIAKGKFAEAILDYKKAWTNAVKAQ